MSFIFGTKSMTWWTWSNNLEVWKHRRFTKYKLFVHISVHISYRQCTSLKSEQKWYCFEKYILTTVILFISNSLNMGSIISTSVMMHIETKIIQNVGLYSVPASELCCWQIRSTRKSSRLEEAAEWGPQTSALSLQQCSGGTHRRAWLVRHSCSSNSIFDVGSRSKLRDISWRHPGGTGPGWNCQTDAVPV